MDQPELSGGAAVRPPNSRDVAFPTVPAEVDMTGVDPLRLEEVRRRIAAIRSYLAVAEPDDVIRRAHAAEVGLSVNQFLGLVRAWREHGRADAISGAGAARGTPRPKGARNLPTESKDAARAVVASLGSDVSHVDAVAAVEARCSALGVKAPSRSTIWNMVMAARRDAGQHGGAAGLVVSRCHVKLPVEENNAVVFPAITLVVDTADGAVLAAAMDDDGYGSGIIGDVVREQADGREIVADAEIVAGVEGLDPSAYQAIKPSAARTATARTLGRGFGAIKLVYQISRAIRPERVLRSRKDRALRPEDARRVVLQQLTAHNAARGIAPPRVSWLSRPGSPAAA